MEVLKKNLYGKGNFLGTLVVITLVKKFIVAIGAVVSLSCVRSFSILLSQLNPFHAHEYSYSKTRCIIILASITPGWCRSA
jgi:hypothetical protein